MPVFPETIDLPGYNPLPKATDDALQKMLDLIRGAKQPMIYCGGGIVSGENLGRTPGICRTHRHPWPPP